MITGCTMHSVGIKEEYKWECCSDGGWTTVCKTVTLETQ